MARSTSAPPTARTRGIFAIAFVRRLTSGLADVAPRPDLPPWSPALLLLFAAAFALRIPWMGAMPNPWGPETDAALRALGDPHAPAAANIGEHLLTAATRLSFAVAGPSIAAARWPVAIALLALTFAASLLVRRRLALTLAFVALAHPWSLAWSRTAFLPAISLGFAVLGPLAWYRAVRGRNAGAMVVAGQILAAGAYFSPLAIVPALACVAWAAMPAQRVVLYRREGWIAVLGGALHAAVALHFSAPLHLHRGDTTALRMAFDAISGVSAVRHFAGASSTVTALATSATILLVALSVRRVVSDPLGRFAAMQLGAAFVLAPVLAGTTADAAGFLVVAPWAMWCAAWANTRPARARIGAGLLSAALVAWMASQFLQGGAGVAARDDDAGGGFYGWQVPRERQAIVVLARNAARADSGGAPAVMTWSDPVFDPMRFALATARGCRLTAAAADDAMPGGQPVYRITDGRRVMMGWRRIAHWTMTGGTPLAALWRREPAP